MAVLHRVCFAVTFVTVVAALSAAASAQEPSKPGAARHPAWTTSRLVGAPEAPAPYRIVPAFPKLSFAKPSSVEELPGTGRLLVTEIGGKVFTFPHKADAAQPDLALDLQAVVAATTKGNVSLWDAEPHPKFAENRTLFVCYVHPGNGGQTRVSRLKLSAESPPKIDPSSEQVIITWPSGGHNAGCLEFGTDGMLYISTGDGAGPNPPDGLTTGQDVSDLLGSILRIDVDHPTTGAAYSVPKDNPFVDLKDARPEIWAYGLRNPWKFGIDPKDGEIFVADNGWESWEMVHRIERGSNCGWPVMEGRAALRTEVKVGPTPIRPPVVDHPHTEANSVIGGPVYRGKKLPGLDGWFVYGDYITGTIWALHANNQGGYSHSTLVDTDLQIVGFTQTTSGELLVLDFDFTGQIYELLPNEAKDNSADFPRLLSETGLFKSVETLEPAPGVVPYQVQVERWDDGAKTQRWIAIPSDKPIVWSADPAELPQYPEGTVLVKHLALLGAGGPNPLRLETQLLHFEQGTWRPYSYEWDESGKDARLVEAGGSSRVLKLPDPEKRGNTIERTWHVNAVNECKLCHNAAAGFVLGFVPNQLDRPRIAGGLFAPRPSAKAAAVRPNQVDQLAAEGVVSQAVHVGNDDARHLVDPADLSASLEDRARSYLHANCSMCHHPRGNAIVSFYLRRDMPFEKLNTNKGTGIGTFGMQNAKIIAPGDPYRSVLIYRMSKLGYARMPYIGSRMVDGVGVSLIQQWIADMGAQQAGVKSAPTTEGSAEARALQQLAENDTPRAEREAALRQLTASTEGALALLPRLYKAELPLEEIKTAVKLGAAAKSTDVRGLFETFVPESQRRPTLGPHIDPQLILTKNGDAERGKLIYFSDGARCRACHEINDKALSLGPTLRDINKKYAKPDEMLQHVLQPSLKIDEPFAAFTIHTEDGRVLTGLIASQTNDEVVLRTIEKRTIKIPRSDIQDQQRSPKSLMPDSILSDLTAQEAADLFAYIRSLGAAE